MNEIIKIENLSKVYKVRNKRDGKTVSEDFWALRNLSIKINQGDVFGVIGKNGSGKSTLLKILSKITSPTSGRAIIKGRVGSLLEVGTGFHHEMTGRENIYMNGNILGMSNSEVKKKFDEIIDFSGVSNFLDTPVKRYSSGMQTRLAFSVAAHLEPEVLLIDEVLSVGDAQFQKKCIGKMEAIGKSGRTIIFVSHNMNAIKNLCTRCLWMKDGQNAFESNDVSTVVAKYLKETVPVSKNTLWDSNSTQIIDNQFIEFLQFRLMRDNGDNVLYNIDGTDDVYVEIVFNIKVFNPDLNVGFALYNSDMTLLFMSYNDDHKASVTNKFDTGRNTLIAKMPVKLLNTGDYTVQLISGIHNDQSIISRTDSNITISFSLEGNSERSNRWTYLRPTIITPLLEWKFKSISK